jgi:hypothetical protein
MNNYGPYIDAQDVHNAVVAFVKRWQASYLGEMAVRKGLERGSLPLFKSFVESATLDRWPEDALPSLITFIPGTDDVPTKEGDSSYTTIWPVGLGVVVSGADKESTYRLLMAYMGGLRMMFVQHASVDGFAEWSGWTGDTYDELPFDASRTIQAGIVGIELGVANAVSAKYGFKEPPEDATADPGNSARVESASVIVRGLA